MASAQAKSNAMLTLLTLPGTNMPPEVQARYCQLAMDPYPDDIVLQAAEEAALTLDRRPTPGEFRNIAEQLIKLSQQRAYTQRREPEPLMTPEEAAEEAIKTFQQSNPQPEELHEFTHIVQQALQNHNYARIGYLLWGQRQALERIRKRRNNTNGQTPEALHT